MHRRQLAGERAGAQGLADHVLGNRLAFEDAGRAVRRSRARRLRAGARARLGQSSVLCGDIDPGIFHVGRIVRILHPQLHADEVDDAFEVVALPGRDRADGRDDDELFLHLLDAIVEVGPHAIELVDKGDARHAVRWPGARRSRDCTSTPPTAQKTPTAPSRTRRLRSTSAVKSTCPGVSISVMRYRPTPARRRHC